MKCRPRPSAAERKSRPGACRSMPSPSPAATSLTGRRVSARGGGALQSDNVTDELKAQGISRAATRSSTATTCTATWAAGSSGTSSGSTPRRARPRRSARCSTRPPSRTARRPRALQTARYFTDKITYQPSQGNRIIGFYAWSYKGNVGAISQFVPWDSRTDAAQQPGSGQGRMADGEGQGAGDVGAVRVLGARGANDCRNENTGPRRGPHAGHQDAVRHRTEHPRRAVELPEHERRANQGDDVPARTCSSAITSSRPDSALRTPTSAAGIRSRRTCRSRTTGCVSRTARRSSSRCRTTRTTPRSCINTPACSSRTDGRSRAG